MNCVATPAQYSSGPNTLSTPDPHYIPGYVGYLPQAKYRPGHTYGMTSHRVLLDPCIHMSPRSVLTNIHPEYCTDEFGRPGLGADPFLQNKMALVESRVNSFGRQQYLPNMVPGYTGYVPRFQSILGHTYSPACNRALARFEQDQWRDRLFSKELDSLDGWRFCHKTKPWDTPENRQDTGDFLEVPRQPCCGGVTAYPRSYPAASVPVPAVNQQRGGGCGCSGRKSCGGVSTSSCRGGGCSKSIKLTPDNSRCDYGEKRIWGLATQEHLKKTCGLEVRLNPHSFIKPLNRLQVLYHDCEGMLPNYQGHVPGEQFRFGKTYGSATRNAKRVITKKYPAPLCSPITAYP